MTTPREPGTAPPAPAEAKREGASKPPKKITVQTLRQMKAAGERITMVTAYDATFARIVDDAGADVILVGDSVAMVIQGHDTTVPVTVNDIIYHSRSVRRGLGRAFLVADMPFMSYPTPDMALANAVRLMQEGAAEVVKLESGPSQVATVKFLASHDIAVCAHLGLKPQSVHKTGGFRVQGREPDAATRMIESAQRLEEAGADLILLECIPAELGQRVTAALSVPVIGIGAGPHTDGQILVLYDVLGITMGRKPRFVLDCMERGGNVATALRTYVTATKSSQYPAPEHCFS